VTTRAVFQEIKVKALLEAFHQHITNHYGKHSDLYFIYLFPIFLLG